MNNKFMIRSLLSLVFMILLINNSFAQGRDPSLIVTEPAQGSIWEAGSEQLVIWRSEDIRGKINILLSTDGGNSFPIVLKKDVPDREWDTIQVPDIFSQNCIIKVESEDEKDVFGLSGIFTIESNTSIIISEPSSSSNWIVGTVQNIVWSSVNLTGNVNIKLSTDGGESFPIILHENIQNDGTEGIIVPDNPSDTSVIKVESTENNNLFGISAAFKIGSQPSITIAEPSASAVWTTGTQQNVIWSSVNVSGNVNIKLSTDGGASYPVTLLENIQNDGSEIISVPGNPSATSVIRIESAEDNNIFGLSEVFRIESLPSSITVTEPMASSVWIAGTQQNVVWSSENISGNVNIKMSTDGGVTFAINLAESIPNDGSESIQVPENPSTTSVIRVESSSDNNIFGVSGTFIVESAPALTVTEPTASSKWVAGTQQNVAWLSVNVPGNVNIKLSTNGGITFPITLMSDIPNDGSEVILVPEITSILSVIRVESSSNNNVFGNSSVFTIELNPVISVSEPSVSSIWISGTQQNVVWSSENLPGNVNIKLSIDGGNTYPFTLRSNIDNDGNEIVEVPDNPSGTSVIKVESAIINEIFGLSGTFRIESLPTITVTEPTASSNWVAGTQQNVLWISENIQGNVNIKLSIDGGVTFPVTLKSNSTNDGSEVVDVPNNPSSNSVIKVESAFDNSIFGISQGQFSIIIPVITVTSPAAGVNWSVGSRQEVTWSSENLSGSVNIKLSLDGGSTYPITLKSNTKDDGKETITIPDNPSSTSVIKIESSVYNDFFGISEGTFIISTAPQITVLTPSDAANWTIGSQQQVTWNSLNISGNVNIKLSTDGGATFPLLLKSNTSNDGSENVAVPDFPSSACIIKVESTLDNSIFGLSEGSFTITSAPTISVITPLAGDNWINGTQQTVTWTSVNVPGNINIKLSIDGGNTFSITLASNIPNDGIETIQVPDNQSDDSRIKVESAADVNIFGLNPGAFTISPVPSILVSQPSAAANWTIGTQQTITWNSENISGSVNIRLSTDGGNTFQIVLKSGISNDGSEVINVPDNPSETARIKVEAAEDNSVFGLNPGNFIIQAESKIVVTSPVQSATWTIGSEQTVDWSSENVTGNVNIKLSTDGGNTFPITLKSSTGNDGSEKIIVPNNPSQNSRIKVESSANTSIFGVNPANFSITSQPTITVTSPFPGTKWTIGSEQTISWTSEKVTGSVNIKLSTDGGSTFPVLLKSSATNDGSEKIIVPDNPSQTCRIKIESVIDSNVFGVNSGNFTITTEPTIIVTAPLQSEKWIAGLNQSVKWNSVNVTGNVNIKLSTDGGNTFPIVLKSETANDGTELVLVPTNASVTCRIRVESLNDNQIFGLNSGNFEITPAPSISVSQPEAAIVWAAGSRQSIVWSSTNISGNVNIMLSTDGGITFPFSLKSNTANDGAELIVVPSNQSQLCRIKVESAADNKIYGFNPGIFRITRNAELAVISPEAQTVWIAGSKRTVTWSSANLIGNINIKLSTNGGSSFPVILKSNTPNDNSEIIDIPNHSSITCRILIESVSDNSIFAVSDSDFAIITYPDSISISNTLVFDDFTDGKSYKIIGIPGSSTVPINLSGEYVFDWQVFWDNGNDQDYLISGKDYTFSPGKAYWIVSKNPLIINQDVEPVPLNPSDNTFSIPLHTGWNLITNPFDQPVNWAAVRTVNNLGENQKLYYWSGNWDSLKSEMVPYEGYYFNNISGLDSLKIPYLPASVFGKSSPKDEYPQNLSQFLSLRINQKGVKEKSEIYIGFDKDAKEENDSKDYFAPPADFMKARLSLLRNELHEREKHFFIEQRPYIGEGQQYDIEIQAVPNKLQQIEIAGVENFGGYNIYLVDELLNNFYNIKELGKLELQLAHRINPFKLLIGTEQYINKYKESYNSLSYELFQNYPNPFNPSTVIRFSLPESNTVNISVYNSIGELVEVLVNEQLYSAGNHEVRFDGLGLSSGIYIVDFRSENFKLQNKMLLMK